MDISKFYSRKTSKYHNKKITVDGILFDSIKEAKRYKELSLLLRAGEIQDLRLQVPYELIPAQREPDIIGKRGGVKKGKCIERSVVYVADFVYKTKDGKEITEDAKSPPTRKKESYVIKRKLLLWLKGIRLHEV